MSSVTSAGSLAGLWLDTSRHASRRFPMGMTVRDRVAAELRHRILLGEFSPGDRIDLDALAEEFGVSRTPVREALLALSNDNLVRLAPRSGITVLGITETDLLDNFELMASLAGMAAAYAADRATDQERAQLERNRDAVERAFRSGGDTAQANYVFHRHVNQASHSPRVMTLIAQVARLFPERLSDVVPEQLTCSLPEHAEVVDAILAKEAGRSRTLMERHFRHAEQRLRKHLDSQQRRAHRDQGRYTIG